MKTRLTFTLTARIAAVMALVAVLAGCSKPAPQPKAKPVVAVVKTNSTFEPGTNQYVSVFEDLRPPTARDPFFPDSHRRDPAPPQQTVEHRAASVAGELLLKGIVGSSTHRLAVINNEIFESGEESSVRVPSGQVRVRCLEIGNDYVVIRVAGEAQSKRLEMAKKSY
jgi:hypothetical protein